MKISLSLLVSAVTAKGAMKEWEVQNAYFADVADAYYFVINYEVK